MTSAHLAGSSAEGHTPELFEYSARTWELLRVRDLRGQGGQRLLVLRGRDGAQRVVTSRCDCDAGGLPGAVSLLPDDPLAGPLVLTRASLSAPAPR